MNYFLTISKPNPDLPAIAGHSNQLNYRTNFSPNFLQALSIPEGPDDLRRDNQLKRTFPLF